jgi:DNA polymerase-3 subunit epsilon
MWEWFKKQASDAPKFWKDYLDSFRDHPVMDGHFLVFDCETTGLDVNKDVILSIGGVRIVHDIIYVEDSFEIFLKQDLFKTDSVAIHGIRKEEGAEKVVEAEAIIQFLERIQNRIIVGHHVGFDMAMVNKALGRLGVGKLKNKTLDTDAMFQKYKHLPAEEHHSLDDLCQYFKIPMHDRHTAAGDAYLTALVFLKLKKKLS